MSQEEEADISVNAAVLAAALGLPPAEVMRRIRGRRITAVHEHGVGEDLGRERLIFYAGNRCVQLLIGENGQVLECRVSQGHRRSPSVRGTHSLAERAEPAAAASQGRDEPQRE